MKRMLTWVLTLVLVLGFAQIAQAADEIGFREDSKLYFDSQEITDEGIFAMAMSAPEGMALCATWYEDGSMSFQYGYPIGYPSNERKIVEKIPIQTSYCESTELMKFEWEQVRVLWAEELKENRTNFHIFEIVGDYAFFMGNGWLGCLELIEVKEAPKQN